MRRLHLLFSVGLILLASPVLAQSVVFDEAVDGDLSGVGTAPTSIFLTLGLNQINGSFGTTGGSPSIGSGATNGLNDADFFSIDINPIPGASITSITTTRSDGAGPSFIGHAAASDIVGVTASSVGNLTSGALFDNGPLTLSAGTLNPLPSVIPLSGPNAFLIQETGAGSFDYTITFNVEAVTVPEPTGAALLGGMALCGFLRRRKR